jgi:hypothetical protein
VTSACAVRASAPIRARSGCAVVHQRGLAAGALGDGQGAGRGGHAGERHRVNRTVEHRVQQPVPRPQPSAASIQPWNPMPVVATTASTGSSSSPMVAAWSSVSSASGTIRIASPYRTVAPLRTSSAPSSCEVGGQEDDVGRHR